MEPPTESERRFTFEVVVSTFGKGDDHHVRQVATVLGRHLNRAFDLNRIEVTYRGAGVSPFNGGPVDRRVTFDPLALDGEHDGHTRVVELEP